MRHALAIVLLLAAGAAHGHALAPALLELREAAPGRYDVLWRTSVMRAAGADVAPRLPDGCVEQGPRRRSFPDADALEMRWTVDCGEPGLVGQTIAIAGLERAPINVIVRLEHGNDVTSTLLDAAQPRFVVAPRSDAAGVFARYANLGARHLLSGLDHLLFVAGLVLLVGGPRRLLLTVTAFTLGHSATLAAATLGAVAVDAALMELGIAFSILALACELARPAGAAPSLLARHPSAMAAAFGLLHGLGFAGSLSDIGLPAGEIPLALLAFNLGIEAGQIAVVGALLLAALLLRRLAGAPAPALRALPVYAIGSFAAYACLDRAVPLFI